MLQPQLDQIIYSFRFLVDHKEYARDKPFDRTATCPEGKVLKLARWDHMHSGTRREGGCYFTPKSCPHSQHNTAKLPFVHLLSTFDAANQTGIPQIADQVFF